MVNNDFLRQCINFGNVWRSNVRKVCLRKCLCVLLFRGLNFRYDSTKDAKGVLEEDQRPNNQASKTGPIDALASTDHSPDDGPPFQRVALDLVVGD